jgi:hypothetical protein
MLRARCLWLLGLRFSEALCQMQLQQRDPESLRDTGVEKTMQMKLV